MLKKWHQLKLLKKSGCEYECVYSGTSDINVVTMSEDSKIIIYTHSDGSINWSSRIIDNPYFNNCGLEFQSFDSGFYIMKNGVTNIRYYDSVSNTWLTLKN